MQKYVKSYHSYVSILKNTQFMNFYNVIILLTYIPTYLYTHNAVLLRSFGCWSWHLNVMILLKVVLQKWNGKSGTKQDQISSKEFPYSV